MLIKGLKFFIQNVYPLEKTLLDPFRQRETWIFIHAWIPMLVRIHMPDNLSALVLCYGWETFEVSWFIPQMLSYYLGEDSSIYLLASWMGHELSSDSLIGDVGQGFTAILWASYFMKWADVPSGELAKHSSKKQKLWRAFLIIILGISALLTVIQLNINPDKPLFPNTLDEFRTNPWNTVYIGFLIWIPLQLVILYQFYKSYCTSELFWISKRNIVNLFRYITIYFSWHSIITSQFFFPTYYSYWASTPFLCLLFSIVD